MTSPKAIKMKVQKTSQFLKSGDNGAKLKEVCVLSFEFRPGHHKLCKVASQVTAIGLLQQEFPVHMMAS